MISGKKRWKWEPNEKGIRSSLASTERGTIQPKECSRWRQGATRGSESKHAVGRGKAKGANSNKSRGGTTRTNGVGLARRERKTAQLNLKDGEHPPGLRRKRLAR